MLDEMHESGSPSTERGSARQEYLDDAVPTSVDTSANANATQVRSRLTCGCLRLRDGLNSCLEVGIVSGFFQATYRRAKMILFVSGLNILLVGIPVSVRALLLIKPYFYGI